MEIDKTKFDAVVKGFSKEDKADFDKLNAEEQQELVAEIIALEEDATTVGGSVETENAVIESMDDCRLHVAGGLLLKKGRQIVAQYLGRQYLFSREKKENWEEVVALDGITKMFRSQIHRFRRTDGTEFGVFATPMMNNALRTVLTASSGAGVGSDPVVKFIYDGKVEKAEAKEKYGFEMSTGNETHGWQIELEKNAQRRTGKGVMNPLNAPLPSGPSDTGMTSEQATLNNFKELHGGASAPQIENNTAAIQ